MRSYEELRAACKAKGYSFFEKSLNLIGERTDDTFDNKFSDFLHVAYTDANGSKGVLTIPWTTLAGTLGKGGVFKPVTAAGLNVATGAWESVTGVAVLCEGQYSRTYEFKDSYVGWLKYPYLQQVAPVRVYRDNTINSVIDRKSSVVHEGLFGINIHRMSNNGVVSAWVNYAESAAAPNGVTWSQGCQGAIEPEFKKILPLLREDAKRFGNLFTYTLLHTNDF